MALVAIPSSFLFNTILTSSTKASSSVLKQSLRMDELVSALEIDASWLDQPLTNQTIKTRFGCGNLPLAMVAVAIGRAGLLAENSMPMSLGEASNCISSCIYFGDTISAISIFENASSKVKEDLALMIWRGVYLEIDGKPMPSVDPPDAWWDYVLNQNHDRSPPPLMLRLIKERPHMARSLAGAMLRSGLHHIETLAQANPGLRGQEKWENRNVLEMAALGVVMDSWVDRLEKQVPTEAEIHDLQSKLLTISTAMGPEVGTSKEHVSWLLVGYSLLRLNENSIAEENWAATLGCDVDFPALVEAVIFIHQTCYANADTSSLSRWAKIAVLALRGASRRSGQEDHLFDSGNLDFLRIMFLVNFVGRDPGRQMAVASAMKLGGDLYRVLRGDAAGDPENIIERELWSLFIERCEQTSAWQKIKPLPWNTAKTTEKIRRLYESGALPYWPSNVADQIGRTLANDDGFPDWMISIFQKESLRSQDRGGSEGTTRQRGRL